MTGRAEQPLLKGLMSELPEAQRTKIEGVAEQLRQLIKDAGPDGYMAFAIVGFEVQAIAEADDV